MQVPKQSCGNSCRDLPCFYHRKCKLRKNLMCFRLADAGKMSSRSYKPPQLVSKNEVRVVVFHLSTIFYN
ncbi:MAG: hypothetical protein IJ714_05630, partial [Bacteroidales bacterium]|nr:hypothetical protein [Bacteroidales bacterium]